MHKLILAAVCLVPFAAHAQSATDVLAGCKHRAEPVAAPGSPRYRQIVNACMDTEVERIGAHAAALNAQAACLNRGGTMSSCRFAR